MIDFYVFQSYPVQSIWTEYSWSDLNKLLNRNGLYITLKAKTWLETKNINHKFISINEIDKELWIKLFGHLSIGLILKIQFNDKDELMLFKLTWS